MATPLTAHDLIQQPLPTIRRGPYTTMSDSTQNIYFRSTLGEWRNFEKEVRKVVSGISWSSNPPALAYTPPRKDRENPNHVSHEQLFCGDEHSVVARFGQNAGHVMTSVCRSIGQTIRFADYKASDPENYAGKVPDIAVITESGHIRILGEAKTPWRHNIQQKMNGSIPDFRRYLGQISKYMHTGKVKYGFLTTYDQTIFLKQTPHQTRKGRWVLWHSPAIMHNTESQAVKKNDSENALSYRHKVSLRECLLFLTEKANSGNYRAENTMSAQRWCGAIPAKDDIDDYVTDGSSSEGSRHSSPSRAAGQQTTQPTSRSPSNSPPRATTTNRPSTRAFARQMETVTGETALLNITPQPQQGSSTSGREGIVTVYRDDRTREWFFRDPRGNRINIDLKERSTKDGKSYYFIYKDIQYAARIDKGKGRQ